MDILKGKKIVVTGGAGFIGSHIVGALVSVGSEVVVIDDLSTGKIENIALWKDKIKFVETSITHTDSLIKEFDGAYAICHQAALPSVPKSISLPLETHEANSTGTLSVFFAAKENKVERVIYASSSSVYGDTPTLPKEESMEPKPLSPYAAQKLTAELYGQIFFSIYGLKTIGLRYFNVFGPRQDPDSPYSAVIPKFIKLISNGQNPTINGDGEHTRDFTYVDNIVFANLQAIRSQTGFGESYNIATGNRVSLNELVKKISDALGVKVNPEYKDFRHGDIKDSFADVSKAMRTFGYKPAVGFDEGLNKAIQYYRGN